MKKFFQEAGILAQIPAMLAVLILFPIFGTSADDIPVKVNASFYVWQGMLCLAPVIQHIVFIKLRPSLDEGTQKATVWAFFLVSFVVTVLNCMRFQ